MYNSPHPGEALRLDALAAHLGYSPRQLRPVLNGHAPTHADLTHRLD